MDKNREIRELAKEIFSDIQNNVRHEQWSSTNSI
jgi:hypothetical protein